MPNEVKQVNNVIIWYPSVHQDSPTHRYNKPDEKCWEIQMRTDDPDTVAKWKKMHLTVTDVKGLEGEVWKAHLRQNCLRADGTPSRAPKVFEANGQLMASERDKTIGSKSIANVKFTVADTRNGKFCYLLSLQVLEHIAQEENDYDGFDNVGETVYVTEEPKEEAPKVKKEKKVKAKKVKKKVAVAGL